MVTGESFERASEEQEAEPWDHALRTTLLSPTLIASATFLGPMGSG